MGTDYELHPATEAILAAWRAGIDQAEVSQAQTGAQNPEAVQAVVGKLHDTDEPDKGRVLIDLLVLLGTVEDVATTWRLMTLEADTRHHELHDRADEVMRLCSKATRARWRRGYTLDPQAVRAALGRAEPSWGDA